MATTAQAATSKPGSPSRTRETLRIMHAGAAPAGKAVFASAASLGFSHVLTAPPWQCGRAGDPYLSSAFVFRDEGASSEAGGGLQGLVAAAEKAGLGLLLDVVVDRLAAESPVLEGSPFAAPSPALLLDPRRSEGADSARPRLESSGEAMALAGWWAERLSAWCGEGVAGFRLIGLEDASGPVLASFFGTLRRASPDCLLLWWTPGVARQAMLSVAGAGLDGVFASLPWWDWQADWLWREIEELGRVAPVLGVDAIPPGPGHGVAGVTEAPRCALAAVIGQGWMHVGGADGTAAAATVRALNGVLAERPEFASRTAPVLPLGGGAKVLGVLRLDGADRRFAQSASLALVNAGGAAATVAGAEVLPALGGRFGALRETARPGSADAGGEGLQADGQVAVVAGGVRVFSASAKQAGTVAPAAGREGALAAARAPRLAIERVTPSVDDGAFPVKAIAGELVRVEADIVFDGHEKIAAALRWLGPDDASHEIPMLPLGNDRWRAQFPLRALGRHSFVVLAWRDRFETFRDELAKKSQAGQRVKLETEEGEALIGEAAKRRASDGDTRLQAALRGLSGLDEAARVERLLSPDLATLMAEADDRPFLVESASFPVEAERLEARFASWYEIFPRSMSDDETRHGTFADVEKHLPRIAAMGFDVLYFPPISPIGKTNRKGRNNSLTPSADDPGSPYAIGAEEGGHDALHPQLGSLEDFAHLRREAARHGLELAIDFAVQCSPDHPWLKQHPGWFDWRPDGSIRYAENPPKRYEDIVNVDFYAKDAVPDLWLALRDVVLFWAEQGIRLFRVDNPHTKPFPFWAWMIGEVRGRYPDAIFLAEAFTRPKIMYRLAKIGFSQSYTYFTWRNAKRELEEYLTELTEEAPRDFFRPHFFVNTPDINPIFLQNSGRPGFLIRAALAATLSGLWGVYNGFELCEAVALPGREEYVNSEKYQLRAWDWDRPGNIVAEVTALNRMRRQNPALQTHLGVSFLPAYNDAVLFFEKATQDRSNVVLAAVSLDPFQTQDADIELPLWHWGLPDDGRLALHDLVEGSTFVWQGKYQHVRLTPERPFALWRARSTV